MDQVSLFFEMAKSDSGLLAKLHALAERKAGNDAFVGLAAEYGFVIPENIATETMRFSMGELGEDDLESVSGGFTINRHDPKACVPGLSMKRNECTGWDFFGWCDHYRREDTWDPTGRTIISRKHECVMKCFKYSSSAD